MGPQVTTGAPLSTQAGRSVWLWLLWVLGTLWAHTHTEVGLECEPIIGNPTAGSTAPVGSYSNSFWD